MRRLLLGPIMAVVLLAACGDDGEPKTPPRQAASIIAKHATAIRDALDYEDNCRSIDCLALAARINRYDDLTDKATALGQELRRSAPFDEEVVDIAEDLMELGDRLVVLRGDATKCLQSKGTLDDCDAEIDAYIAGWQSLGPALDAWAPYL